MLSGIVAKWKICIFRSLKEKRIMSNNYPQNPSQRDQYGNQGNQGQQDQYGNQNQQGNQGQQGALGGARQMAENQINQAIDQYGNKIPGGSKFTQQAKDAADGVLNNLEQEAEKRMGNLGGLFGGNQNNQNQ